MTSQLLLTGNWVMTGKVRILDTTLRDGDQTAGFAFTPEQKVHLAKLLDACGVDCIEAGFPCSSPADYSSCLQIAASGLSADIAVMTRSISQEIIKSAGVFLEAHNTSRAVLHLTVPVSRIQIEAKFHKTDDEILHLIKESVGLASSLVSNVEAGFEDATRADRSFLAACCRAAVSSGASVINIADTTGCLLPDECAALTGFLMREIPAFADGSVRLSIHCHNDLGLALACTLAAVKAGASQAEVTAAGLGERCGNTPLEELAHVLSSRSSKYGVTHNLRPEHFAELFRTLFSYCGTSFSPLKPVTGWNSDSHASGLHQQGMYVNPRLYIENPAEPYGIVHRRFVLSRHSGKAGLLAAVNDLWNGSISLTAEQADSLLALIKMSPEHETGITSLCSMMYQLKITSTEPFIPQSITVSYKKNRFIVHASVQEMVLNGGGASLEQAVLDAVNKLSANPLCIKTVSVSRYVSDVDAEPEARVYAEITDVKTCRLYAVTACRKTEADALFRCLFDVVNGILTGTPL